MGESERAEYVVQQQMKAVAARVQHGGFQMQHVRNIMLIASMLGKGLSTKLGQEDEHESSPEQFMSVFMWLVTLLAMLLPILIWKIRQWASEWSKKCARIEELESHLEECERNWFSELERANHAEEIFQVVKSD